MTRKYLFCYSVQRQNQNISVRNSFVTLQGKLDEETILDFKQKVLNEKYDIISCAITFIQLLEN